MLSKLVAESKHLSGFSAHFLRSIQRSSIVECANTSSTGAGDLSESRLDVDWRSGLFLRCVSV